MADILYSIHEKPGYAEQQRGFSYGDCIVEASSREEAIKDAECYFSERAEHESNYGKDERDLILVAHTPDTGEETEESITISWDVEEDEYDGGRFDHLAAIGAIRTF